MKALIVAPHHDDEAIGCGGTAALLAEQNVEVSTLHVFAGFSGAPGRSRDDGVALRTEEAVRAGRVLGSHVLPCLGMEDRLVERESAMLAPLIRAIRAEQPTLMFIPHRGEQDREHSLVSRNAWEASWLAAMPNFPELGLPSPAIGIVLGYEVWTPLIDIGVFVDISGVVDKKRRALAEYASQLRYQDWLSGAIGLNAYRGTSLQGAGFAEAFSTLRMDARALHDFGAVFGNLA